MIVGSCGPLDGDDDGDADSAYYRLAIEADALRVENRLLICELRKMREVLRDITETLEELRARHVRRVAYFVVHDWTCPLLLDGPKLIDGHHRFAAALYRGDAQVEIQVLFS